MALAALGLAALLVRLAYLVELRSDPFLGVALGDGASYLAWAREIQAGDWLSQGQGVFYQAPLYPYLLSALLGLGLPFPASLLGIQVVLGAASAVLVAAAGRALFGHAAGLIAGWILALYPPALFFDLQLDKTCLSGFLIALTLWLFARAIVTPSRAAWACLGLALGVTALARETVLALAPLAVLWPWASARQERRARLSQICGFVLGLLIVLVPVAARNQWVGGVIAVTTSQSGPNFYIGNFRGATGSYVPLLPGRGDAALERLDARQIAESAAGRPLNDRQISTFFWRRALAEIRADPLDWLRLMAWKLRLVSHRYEVPDLIDFGFAAQRSRLLNLFAPWLNFATLFALAVLGALLPGKSDSRPRLAVIAVTVVLALTTAAFFVLDRYRFALVPCVALLAGRGLARVARVDWRGDLRQLRHRRHRVQAAGVCALVAGVVAWWPLPIERPEVRALAVVNEGVALGLRAQVAAAEARYRRALELAPSLLEAHLNLGDVLLATGRVTEAIPHLERAARGSPQDAGAAWIYGRALRLAGRIEEARRELERAQRLPGVPPAVNEDLEALVQSGAPPLPSQ